ncbi:stringent starvation protein B [Erwinia phage AH06]|nr:stringent starvation protein B [Erwinia phage AH06]
MSENKKIIPLVHFQIDAFRNFLIANGFTPYAVFALPKGLDPVLDQFINDGQIILNVGLTACGHYEITDDGYMVMEQRFNGKPHRSFVPVKYLLAMYAREDVKHAMMFPDLAELDVSGETEMLPDDQVVMQADVEAEAAPSNVTPLRRGPSLSIVK